MSKNLTNTELKEKLESFIPALKNAKKPIASAALCAFLTFCTYEANAQNASLADKAPSQTTISAPTDPHKTKEISFFVDTLDKNAKPTAYAKTNPSTGTIKIYYVPGDILFNEQAQSNDRLIHEAGHLKHFLRGAYDYAVSPLQAAVRSDFEEIAVNIEVLVHKRAEYLETGNLDVFNGFFSYYREAIENGTIIPDSKNLDEFEKEMRFIYEETKTNWIIHKQKDYGDQELNQADNFGDYSGKYRNFWNANYEESLNNILTICGINFWKYHTDDPKIPTNIQKKINDKKSKTPQVKSSTTNDPIYRSSIAKVPQYPEHTPWHRVSKPITVQVNSCKITPPPEYQQYLPFVEEEPQQPIVENDVQETPQKEEKKIKIFWEKVKDFFRPSWKEKPQKNSASTTTTKPKATNRITPKPSAQAPKPKSTPVRTPVQNPQKVDTLAQNSEVTVQGKPTAKEKWHNFWENTGKTLGDIFRPSWCEKPEDKPAATPVDTDQSSVTPVDTVQAKTAAPSVQAPNNEIRTPAQPTTTPDTNVQNADSSATTNHISPKALRKKIEKQKSAEIQKQKDTYRKKHNKSSTKLSREQAYNKRAAERVARMTKD